MNKIFRGVLMILLLLPFVSCRNDLSPFEDGSHRVPHGKDTAQKRTVRMSFGGDYISESEEPLHRADDAETFVGINVFRKENKADAEEENYAYGVFKRTNDISIDLLTGYTYRFEAAIIVEGTDRLTLLSGRYAEPFQLINGVGYGIADIGGNSNFIRDKVDTGFIYSYKLNDDVFVDNKDRDYLCQLKYGTSYVDTHGDASPSSTYAFHPRVSRYYGESEYSFDPWISADEEGVNINMKYLCFGLKFVLANSDLSGDLKIEDVSPVDGYRKKGNGVNLPFPKDLTLNNDVREFEEIYSLYNVYAAHENPETYSEEFTLRFKWIKAAGVEPETFDRKIVVHPRKNKVLRINLDGDPVTNTKGNINLVMGEDALTDEAVENIGNK
ncbi:MAG: hypothetical protein K2K45_12070 [Muribaculaceae bacterium]|nr:hypothetical protein [Muribaculaceae bacterium]